MEMNHHIMAKATTDAILAKLKSGSWTIGDGIGTGLYRIGCDAAFPSPDAVFADMATHTVVSFEFKPTTETKRGILTGIGQSLAYLQNSDISFLIAPRMLQDFRLGDYLQDLYAQQIAGKLPTGLILYDNDSPVNVSLAHNVTQLVAPSQASGLARRDVPPTVALFLSTACEHDSRRCLCILLAHSHDSSRCCFNVSYTTCIGRYRNANNNSWRK